MPPSDSGTKSARLTLPAVGPPAGRKPSVLRPTPKKTRTVETAQEVDADASEECQSAGILAIHAGEAKAAARAEKKGTRSTRRDDYVERKVNASQSPPAAAQSVEILVHPPVVHLVDDAHVEIEVCWRTRLPSSHVHFNFLALHQEKKHFLAYESSYYTMGDQDGKARFLCPKQPGNYQVTLVRDLDEERGIEIDSWTQQAEALGTTWFVVRNAPVNLGLHSSPPPPPQSRP